QDAARGRRADAAIETRITDRPFHYPPAIVAAVGDDVDLFAGALADITADQLPGYAVERPAPGIAQPVGIDFVSARRRAIERIARRRRVRDRAVRRVNVDAQHLAEQ